MENMKIKSVKYYVNDKEKELSWGNLLAKRELGVDCNTDKLFVEINYEDPDETLVKMYTSRKCYAEVAFDKTGRIIRNSSITNDGTGREIHFSVYKCIYASDNSYNCGFDWVGAKSRHLEYAERFEIVF